MWKKIWSKINDFFKEDIWRLILVLMLLVTFTWGAIGYCKSYYYRTSLSKTEYELGQVRTELDNAANRQYEIEAITDDAIKTIDGANEVLSESIITVGEIRARIAFLENYINSLHNYIYCVHNYTSDSTKEE